MKEPEETINQIKAGATLSYFTIALNTLIVILYTPIILTVLGPSDYGLYNLVASILSYSGLLSFGYYTTYIRYYTRYKREDRKTQEAQLNGMFLIIFSGLSIIVALAGMLLYFNTETLLGSQFSSYELEQAKILIKIMVFNLSLSFITSVFNSNITANEEFVFQKSLQLIKTVITPFGMVLILFAGYQSVGLVLGITVIAIGIEISNVVFCFKKLGMKFSFRKFDGSVMREMTIFSLLIFINVIVQQVNWNADQYIIARYKGTVAVGIYGLACVLNHYYIGLSTAVASVYSPQVNRMVARGDDFKLTQFFAKAGRIQCMLLLSVCLWLIVFGQSFIMHWAGVNYKDTYYLMLWLIIPATVLLIQNIGVEIQRSKNLHRFRTLVYIGIMGLNIGISIPLVQYYGGLGAAMGTGISITIGNIILNGYYQKKVGLDIRYFWFEIFRLIPSYIPIGAVCLVIYFGVNTDKWINFFMGSALYFGIYGLSIWFIGMNAEERISFSRSFKKVVGFIKRQIEKCPFSLKE